MDNPKTEQIQREEEKEEKSAKRDAESNKKVAEKSGTEKSGKEKDKSGKKSSVKAKPNNVRKLRMERMMSKAELARRAGLSTLTIDRVEKGMPCRMDTKRKILEALGLTPSDRVKVFGEDD
jgi:DNA-binding XRE family transcriptional regulator